MSPAATPEEAHKEAESLAIYRSCRQFLGGHGPATVHETLSRLLANCGSEERPDHYGEGEIIGDFEKKVATLLGKPAALFLPSGTLAQQIALRIWADRARNPRVGLHATSHLELHEHRGYQVLHGLEGVPLGNPGLGLEPKDFEKVPLPLSAALLELPMRELGGVLPSWEELQAIRGWAARTGTRLHMDGARLWEAQPYYEKPHGEIAALFDSVYVSFYKGLGGVAGAILAGPEDFITEARIWQRRHGGNLISLYPYVISARASLEQRLGRMSQYRDKALEIFHILKKFSPRIRVVPDPPQTNMMHVYFEGDRSVFVAKSLEIARTRKIGLFRGLHPSPVPGISFAELSIGDSSLTLPGELIEQMIRELVES